MESEWHDWSYSSCSAGEIVTTHCIWHFLSDLWVNFFSVIHLHEQHDSDLCPDAFGTNLSLTTLLWNDESYKKVKHRFDSLNYSLLKLSTEACSENAQNILVALLWTVSNRSRSFMGCNKIAAIILNFKKGNFIFFFIQGINVVLWNVPLIGPHNYTRRTSFY